MRGVLSAEDPSSTRLVIDDDQALEVLPAMLARTPGGMLNVLATAPRTAEVLRGDDRWQGRLATAMVTHDVRATFAAALPPDLIVRGVRRTDHDPPTDVSLAAAVDLAVRADPSDGSLTVDSLSSHLRAMPATVRLLAAVDREGSVLGTAGFGAYGRYAHLIFVNTDPRRRGEGIGRAMTTLALDRAWALGAAAAYLDASGDGRRLYHAMGFDTVAELTRFTHQA